MSKIRSDADLALIATKPVGYSSKFTGPEVFDATYPFAFAPFAEDKDGFVCFRCLCGSEKPMIKLNDKSSTDTETERKANTYACKTCDLSIKNAWNLYEDMIVKQVFFVQFKLCMHTKRPMTHFEDRSGTLRQRCNSYMCQCGSAPTYVPGRKRLIIPAIGQHMLTLLRRNELMGILFQISREKLTDDEEIEQAVKECCKPLVDVAKVELPSVSTLNTVYGAGSKSNMATLAARKRKRNPLNLRLDVSKTVRSTAASAAAVDVDLVEEGDEDSNE
jgi:hypothetical protein